MRRNAPHCAALSILVMKLEFTKEEMSELKHLADKVKLSSKSLVKCAIKKFLKVDGTQEGKMLKYKGREVELQDIRRAIKLLSDKPEMVSEKRAWKRVYIAGRNSDGECTQLPCKMVLETACALTNPRQRKITSNDHSTGGAEKFLRNCGFHLSR